MERVQVEVERDLGIPPVNSSSSDVLSATIDAMGRARKAPGKMPVPGSGLGVHYSPEVEISAA